MEMVEVYSWKWSESTDVEAIKTECKDAPNCVGFNHGEWSSGKATLQIQDVRQDKSNLDHRDDYGTGPIMSSDSNIWGNSKCYKLNRDAGNINPTHPDTQK